MQPERAKEHPNTYIVQDRSSEEEMTRLCIQDAMLTESMGGILPEQPGPHRFERVIDVGCGTGGWLIALANVSPETKLLAGIDVSKRMMEFARNKAQEAGVADRVEFHVMDALRMIEFPHNYFDLVNQRLNFSYLRKWDWPNILQEYGRIARPGGIIRITETSIQVESNSDALNQLCDLVLESFYNAGHFFEPGRQGIIGTLPELMHHQGISDVQTRTITIQYENGTIPALIEDIRLLFRTIKPFLNKWTKLPRDYDQVYQQALIDMEQPTFRANYQLMTAWGRNTLINNRIATTEHRQ